MMPEAREEIVREGDSYFVATSYGDDQDTSVVVIKKCASKKEASAYIDKVGPKNVVEIIKGKSVEFAVKTVCTF
jgi:hypothetical protein